MISILLSPFLLYPYLLFLLYRGHFHWLFPNKIVGLIVMGLLIPLSPVNFPLLKTKTQEIKINAAGGIFPLIMSGYLVISSNLLFPACLLTILTTLCMLFISKRKPLLGILIPVIISFLWLTGLNLFFGLILYPLICKTISLCSDIPFSFNLPARLTEQQIIITGYFAATWGTFLGADILNLPLLILPESNLNSVKSETNLKNCQYLHTLNIGGAGVRDAVFLNGIYTGLLTEVFLYLLAYFKP